MAEPRTRSGTARRPATAAARALRASAAEATKAGAPARDGAAADGGKRTGKAATEEAARAPERATGGRPPKPDYPRYRVTPSEPVRLADLDPATSEHYEKKKHAAKDLAEQVRRIEDLQARLYAEQKRSLLVVLQAMDTGGKDGTIKHVFQGVNPQGCSVSSFKQPSAEELAHDFLWRYHRDAPKKGMITIFNRSHYEDVLVVRVKKLVPEAEWRARYELINEFEHLLTSTGVTVLKFFLHISKEAQRDRLESRLADHDKRWKFSKNDITERGYWDQYQAAYEEAINSCSTEHAPWYVVPSDTKWYRNLVVARTIADTLAMLDPKYPEPESGLDDVVIPK